MALRKRKIKFVVRIGNEVLIGYQNAETQPTGIVYAPYVVRYKKPKKKANLTTGKNLLQLG